MSDLDNKRSRKWFLTIHKDDEALNTITSLINEKEPKIALICHNKDINEDGSDKLIHWHVVLEYENARTFLSMKKTFRDCHIEQPNNFDATMQYLTHKNDPNKAQYEYDDIITNNPNWLKGHYEASLTTSDLQKEAEIIERIMQGQYEGFYDLIISNDYDMIFLARRKPIIDILFAELHQRERQQLINDKFKKREQDQATSDTRSDNS